MALNSYKNLQVAISSWLARQDLESQIPDFISLCESTLNNNAEFRIRKMVCKLKGTLSGDEFALPPDYLGMRILRAESGQEITQVSPEAMQEAKLYGCDHQIYLELGQRLEIYPEADELPVGLFYYQQIPPLTDENQTNWLLNQSPNAYLYGSLLEATGFMKNDERINLWASRYKDAVNSMVAADKHDRWSGQKAVRLVS